MGSFFVLICIVQSSNNLIFKNSHLIIQVKTANNTIHIQFTVNQQWFSQRQEMHPNKGSALLKQIAKSYND